MTLYLDTHVVAWLHAGLLDCFTEEGRRRLENATLLVSPMVVLELQYLYEVGRLRFPGSEIIGYLERAIGLQVCQIPYHLVVLEALSAGWTRDPFDRLIAAQCIAGNGFLLTKDETILAHFKPACW